MDLKFEHTILQSLPRVLASRRVDAPTDRQACKPFKPPNKLPRASLSFPYCLPPPWLITSQLFPRPNIEPQSIPEDLDGTVQEHIEFSIVSRCHCMILRDSSTKKNIQIQSHNASQKLPKAPFNSNLTSLYGFEI